MKPVKQTIIDADNGNCLQAAVASILELELDEVPHFVSYGDTWWWEYQQFLAKYNIFPIWTEKFVPYGGWHLESVKSSRFPNETHAVVAGPNGIIVHDPNPDVDPLETEYEVVGYTWFLPIDPAKMVG